jgi:hypothetical protein
VVGSNTASNDAEVELDNDAVQSNAISQRQNDDSSDAAEAEAENEAENEQEDSRRT